MAKGLANWLNSGKDRGQEKVAQAVRLLRGMDGLWTEENAVPDDSPGGQQRQELWRRLRVILDGLENQRSLLRWRVVPLKTPRRRHLLDLAWDRDPGHAFLLLRDVTNAGLSGNLRECKLNKCSKWFLATKGRQQFCSPHCQEVFWEDYRHTQRGRDEMAAYMRKFRNRKKAEARRKSKKGVKP